MEFDNAMLEETNQKQIANWKIITIRIGYIIGMILDFGSALITSIYLWAPGETFINQLFNFPPISEITFIVLSTETALMWGWTALLIWGFLKPVERKAILLLTIFPVLSIILTNVVIGIVRNNTLISSIRMAGPIIALIAMIISYSITFTLDYD
jgi:hypothetical protein